MKEIKKRYSGQEGVVGRGGEEKGKDVRKERKEDELKELKGGGRFFVLFVANAGDTFGELLRKCGFEVRESDAGREILRSSIGRRVVVRDCGALLEEVQSRFSEIEVLYDEKSGVVSFQDLFEREYVVNMRGVEEFKRRVVDYLVDDRAEVRVYKDGSGKVKVIDVKKGHERVKKLIDEINESVMFQDFKYRYIVVYEEGRKRKEYSGWILPGVASKLSVDGEVQVVKRDREDVWLRVFFYRGVDKIIPFKRMGGEDEIKEFVGGENVRIQIKVQESN